MSEFKHISVQAVADNMSAYRVVDIRDPQSYANGHISGSLHLDNHSLPDFIAAADLDHPLIVTCYHGHSSQQAAAWLAGQGFEKVYSLDGGFTQYQLTPGDDVESGS